MRENRSPEAKTMNRRKFIKYGAGGIVGLGVIGAVASDSDTEQQGNPSSDSQPQGSTPEEPASTPTPEPKEEMQKNTIITPEDKLEVLSVETSEGMFGKKVTGVIQNVSGTELGYAQVKIVGFTKNNVQVAEWFDNTTSFPAGGKWKFTVTLTTTSDNTSVAYWKGKAGTSPSL